MEYTKTHPNIPIIFEDNHILVINKPHNVLSQEDHTGDPDVLSLCKAYLKKKHNKTGTVYLGLVHRLDRPVGGLMLLAKTSKAASRLSQQIRDRLIQKTYWAVVWGNAPANGMLTHYLFKDRSRNIVTTVPADHKQGKQAVLSFAKLKEHKGQSLLSIHLQTGRPHQIRVQMAQEELPIWGDYKYGKDNKPDGRTMALRATELILEHPVTKEEHHFTLAPPDAEPWDKFDTSSLLNA
ncbi:MAG: RluA family pseudouridine synthase [Balneolaceae bacterium]|nr:RluA family pseudouridine synthase [Balneolaceae bacterium]